MRKNNKNMHIGQIFMELTNLCNFNCVFCPNDKMTRKRESMDPVLAKRLIDEIADNGISQKIVFCLMGEPLLYPHIFEILNYAVNRNIKVTFSTNGALLSRDNIDKLLEIPLDILQISLQTPSPRPFKLRKGNINLTYDQYIDGVKTLVEKKAKIGGNTKLSVLFMDAQLHLTQLFLNGSDTLNLKFDNKQIKKTANELSAVIIKEAGKRRLTSGEGFKNLIEQFAATSKRLLCGNYRKNFPPGIEFIFGTVHNWGEAMVGKEVLKARFGSCNALTEQFAVLCNGDYTLCCKDYNGDLVIGNAYKEALTEILRSDKVQKIKKDFRRCRLNFERCRICRGGTNIPELFFKQIFTSIIYNAPFIMQLLKKIVLK